MWYVKQAFWYSLQFSVVVAVVYFFKHKVEGDEGPYAPLMLGVLAAYLITQTLNLIIRLTHAASNFITGLGAVKEKNQIGHQ